MTFTVDEISTDYGRSAGNSLSQRDSAVSQAWVAEAYFAEAYKKTHETARAIGREVTVIGGGAVLGAIDHCRKDPVGAALQVGGTAVVGAGLGTLAVAESPLIAGGAVVAGIGTTGVWAANTFWPTPENKHRFGEMGRAARSAWLCDDEATLARSVQSVRENGAELAFDLGTMAFGAGGVRIGAKQGAWMLRELAKPESILAPAVVPGYYRSGWFDRGSIVPSIDELSLFQRRHGKVTTHKGTPETIETLCKQLDAMLVGREKHSNCGRQVRVDWSREVLVPPTHFTKRGDSVYFQKYYTDQR